MDSRVDSGWTLGGFWMDLGVDSGVDSEVDSGWALGWILDGFWVDSGVDHHSGRDKIHRGSPQGPRHDPQGGRDGFFLGSCL